MAGFSANDMAQFRGRFGEAATVDGVAVSGIFQAGYSETLEVAGTAPALQCLATDVPNAAQGQAVTVPGKNFSGTIANVEPDGNGWVDLVLHESG